MRKPLPFQTNISLNMHRFGFGLCIKFVSKALKIYVQALMSLSKFCTLRMLIQCSFRARQVLHAHLKENALQCCPWDVNWEIPSLMSSPSFLPLLSIPGRGYNEQYSSLEVYASDLIFPISIEFQASCWALWAQLWKDGCVPWPHGSLPNSLDSCCKLWS